MARGIDAKRERTLPIMTKIEFVDKGIQNRAIDMIEEQNTSDKLGWGDVRNLGQQELENVKVDKDSLEKEWHRIPLMGPRSTREL